MSEPASERNRSEAEHSEPPQDRPRAHLLLWTGLAILLLYPLSIGPSFRLGRSGTIYALYAPVLYICRRSQPIDHALGWYLQLWGVGDWIEPGIQIWSPRPPPSPEGRRIP